MFKFFFSVLVCLVVTFSVPVSSSAYAATDVICQVNVENGADLNMKNYQSSEVLLGDVIADAVRNGAGADIAVINAGDFIPKLRFGELTWGDIVKMFPKDLNIAVAEVTGVQLKEILETGVSHIVMTEDETIDREASAYGGFPQISGFSFKYDVSAPPQQRVYEMTLASGESVRLDDDQQTYLLAAPIDMLSGGWGYPAIKYTETGITLSDAMGNYLTGLGQITTVAQRAYFRGAINEKPILSASAAITIAVIVIICFGVVVVFRKRYKLNAVPDKNQYENEKNYDPID